jgi:hypothetical protein
MRGATITANWALDTVKSKSFTHRAQMNSPAGKGEWKVDLEQAA